MELELCWTSLFCGFAALSVIGSVEWSTLNWRWRCARLGVFDKK